MAKNNFLVLIRKRMEEIQREFSALKSAYETLDKVSGLRGRKVVIPELTGLIADEKEVPKAKKGKRGRPRKYPLNFSGNEVTEIKKGKGKRGRKKMVKITSKSEVLSSKPQEKMEKSAKVVKEEAPKKKSPGRPKLNKSKEKSTKIKTSKVLVKSQRAPKGKKAATSKARKKRTRVPNLAGKIMDIIKGANRFVTNAEITDKLTSTYPSKDKAQLSKYLSVVMSQMKGRKEAAVIVKDHKGKRMRSGLWGLPNWFENGKAKNEFLK